MSGYNSCMIIPVAPPLIEQLIEPKIKADQEKLATALSKLVAEDPSFTVYNDPESGQSIMKGTSEPHLDTKLDILKRTYKVDANVELRR